MDSRTPEGGAPARALKSEHIALNVLALCFVLALLGRGLSDSFTVFLKPISESFGWDRAQVVSVYSLTFLASGLMAPVIGRLFDRYGPRTVYSLGLLLPLSLLPWRLLAKGSPDIVRKANAEFVDGDWTLASAMRHHTFWALFSTFFFTAIGMYALSAQIVAYLIDIGFPPLEAATAWGFSGVVLVFGMLGVSALDGLIGRRPSVLLSYAISILGIVLLWLLQYSPNILLLTGFVVCFGSMMGSRGPLITATAMKIFRGERVGTIFGTISIGSGLGAALGAWAGGLIHDWTHSYNPVMAFALVAVVLGLIPFLVVPALRR
jgi:MFS family permease